MHQIKGKMIITLIKKEALRSVAKNWKIIITPIQLNDYCPAG